jgi:poly(3-hydroxyalkanoate) synthetase
LGHDADPKESSTKMVWHYGQIIKNNGVFAEYSSDNDTQGKRIPLENITEMPIYLFSGSKDPVATYQDNLTNQKALGNVKLLKKVDGFGHSDYLKPKHVEFQQLLVNTINEINGKTEVESSLF